MRIRTAFEEIGVLVIGLVLFILLGLGVVFGNLKAASATRFDYSTYQFTDGSNNDVCVYVFSAGSPQTGMALTSQQIPGPCHP